MYNDIVKLVEVKDIGSVALSHDIVMCGESESVELYNVCVHLEAKLANENNEDPMFEADYGEKIEEAEKAFQTIKNFLLLMEKMSPVL